MADDTCAELLTRLNAAKAALIGVQNGGAIRAITDSDGSRIEYTSANPARLISYVALLQAMYDACIAGTSPPVVTRPVNFFF